MYPKVVLISIYWLVCFVLAAQAGDPLPGTMPLKAEGDLASEMVAGIDRFLLSQIAESPKLRRERWANFRAVVDESFGSDFRLKKIIPLQDEFRKRLALVLGVRDQRLASSGYDVFVRLGDAPSKPLGELPARNNFEDKFAVQQIRWPVLEGVWGEGLLLEPTADRIVGNVIAIPDADHTPEQIAGLEAGIDSHLQYARLLAEHGYRVFVPALIHRDVAKRGPPGSAGRAELTSREFVYRPAFEMGRHIVGYEIQRVLALVDLLESWAKSAAKSDSIDAHTMGKSLPERQRLPISVVGYGEGGLIALAAVALDQRIDEAYVSGYFGPRERAWQEPIDRNLFGLLNEFGDAELAALVFPRRLTIDFTPGPSVSLQTGGGAPGKLRPYSVPEILEELNQLHELTGIRPLFDKPSAPTGYISGVGFTPLPPDSKVLPASLGVAQWLLRDSDKASASATPPLPQSARGRTNVDRQHRLVQQLLDHTQRLMYDSARVRKQNFQSLDTSNVRAFENSIEPLRKQFYREVIGQFDQPLLSANARSRRSWESDHWVGYEVQLDVFEDVTAYGALLLPKDLRPGERRPVVVCQHGLEGRPTDTFLGDHHAYHDFAAKLCERGYIVFAPQNIYIFQDRFRALQRKANLIGKSLFSIMVPQHQQIVNWLKTLPQVDAQRIAFYGLSYGGKSAMRIPALVPDYCLSICSADFNEWIVKNASTTHPFSYVWTGEYEIFEFNLAHTFNYAEMAALICPRPFMVERGHFDGVGDDEWVAFEYAKVQNLYAAKLGIGDRTEIEWFVGPHTINGLGTFQFLDRHLGWQSGSKQSEPR